MKKEIPVAITLILAILYVAANYFTGVSFLETIRLSERVVSGCSRLGVLVGSISLTQIHGRRISSKKEGWFYSVWLLICLYGMMFFGIFVAKSIIPRLVFHVANHRSMNATVYSTIVFYIGSAAPDFRVRSPEATVLLVRLSLRCWVACP